jgi:hypothetical protein
VKLSAEDREDIDAELGYSVRGERDVRLRDWMSLRGEDGEAARSPREFEALVNRLRAKKWANENPERRRAIANRYALKPENMARSIANARKRRLERVRGRVVACGDCGAEFCQVRPKRGIQRAFCSVNCQARAAYHRKHPNAPRRKARQ